MLKRVVDITLGSLLLVAAAPIMLLVSVAVGLSGPVLFKQRRLGRNARPFVLLKFRTMHVNAPSVRTADGSAYVGENDPRVTRVGRLLRKTSLDELPQLWNVFRGDMSLVGPRPDQVDQLHFYSEQERRKLDVRPGVTGLAQISGRNRISWERRKALDVEYVERQSLWLDLSIILKTVPYVLSRKDVNAKD